MLAINLQDGFRPCRTLRPSIDAAGQAGLRGASKPILNVRNMSQNNTLTLVGTVGALRIKEMQNGKRFAAMSLAVNSSYTGKDGQQVRRPTEWHSVISFNQTKIELLENSVMVGDLVKVTGSLHSRQVVVDGVSRTVSEIKLAEISLVARKAGQVAPAEVKAPAKKVARKGKAEGQGVAA